MSKLVWDKIGERFYETGVDHCILFPEASNGTTENGVAWNGITGITEKPSGAESNPVYADNIKYLDLRSAEEYGVSIEALAYPEAFKPCIGLKSIVPGVVVGQQSRKRFGLVWRSRVGNDTLGDDYGYKLHMAWHCGAGTAEIAYKTVNNNPETQTFSWDCTCNTEDPDTEDGELKATASVCLDETTMDEEAKAVLKQLENTLFGTENAEPTMPTIQEVVAMFSALVSTGGSTGG